MKLVPSLVLVGSVVAVAPQALTQETDPDAPIVERVDIVRNQFLDKETFLFYISTKPGDRYDEKRLKEDFRRVWETGLVEDLFLDVRDGATGKIVAFVVDERRRIQIIDYRGSKVLTNTTIEEELKKREAEIRIDTFYDIGKARRVESVLRGMLADKGRPFATVKHDAKSVGGAGLQLSFVVDDGPKAKVSRIEFEGNTVFSDGDLRRQLKGIKQKGFWNLSWLGGKTTYTEGKWADPQEGDRRRLEDFYLDHGYVTASIGEPRIVYLQGKTGKKPTKLIQLVIPVNEGHRYRVGEVKFEGLTVFEEEAVRTLFELEKGDVYKESRIKKGYDKLRDLYGSQGYFQWGARTARTPDHEKKIVDVSLVMEEDKRYYVGRITFTGNDTTRDKVIRREVYLNEGDVFNAENLKLSIRRINQLGYFKPMEGVPELKPSDLADDKLDVIFKVEEQNRNQFTFGGGYSGLEGAFLNASFSTANFLGQGETLQVSAQNGQRTKDYAVAITEPYLFDRPITAGFDVFDRKQTSETLGYSKAGTGASLVVGLPLGRFTRFFTRYSYEVITIAGLSGGFLEKDQDGDLATPNPVRETPPPGTGPAAPLFDPFLFGQEGRRRESRFTPSFVHNTVDNPYTPRSGMKLSLTPQVAGGILGGTVNFLKPDLELTLYVPHTRRTALGLRAQGAMIFPYGSTERVPYYQRFFLGGETQIRGVPVQQVGPIVENVFVGGNKFVLFNAEYYFDIGGPLRALVFFDAGQAFLEGQRIDLRSLRTSTGAELRFLMPVLNVPLRLIYAFNPNRDAFQKKSTFKFAIGTTF